MMQRYLPFLSWVDTQHSDMLSLLISWVNLNSGTMNPLGIEEFSNLVHQKFLDITPTVEILSGGEFETINSLGAQSLARTGPSVWAETRPHSPLQALLAIHLDTVYGVESKFQTAKFLSNEVLNGPGAADAKGGIVVMLYALMAFERFVEQTGRTNLGWTVLLNSDEEVGSPTSKHHFEKAARRAHFGLLFEPAPRSGGLVSERKGSGNFSIVIQGVSAHSGRDFDRGRNAVVAAAKLAWEVHTLNGYWPGVTINVAKIEGGGPSNIVPDLAVLRLNIRYTSVLIEHEILIEIENRIAAVSREQEVTMKLYGGFLSPPKTMDFAHRHLLAVVQNSGEMLGLSLKVEPSGGACDGNRLASLGVPNIDTMGVRGGDIHSDAEFVEISSLVERAKLTALCLMRFADGDISPLAVESDITTLNQV